MCGLAAYIDYMYMYKGGKWLKREEDDIDFRDILHFHPVSNQVNRIWENNPNLIKGISLN